MKDFDSGREIHKAVYWGLVEAKPSEDRRWKKSPGLWRLTKHGIAFVCGEVDVPTYALVYAKWLDPDSVCPTELWQPDHHGLSCQVRTKVEASPTALLT